MESPTRELVTPQFLNLELDDRRELWVLLDRLEPRKRILWLEWCCRQVSRPGMVVEVISSDGTVEDVFADAMTILNQNGLSLEVAGGKLVQMVRGER